jgi:hypothetical protein
MPTRAESKPWHAFTSSHFNMISEQRWAAAMVRRAWCGLIIGL